MQLTGCENMKLPDISEEALRKAGFSNLEIDIYKLLKNAESRELKKK